VSNVASTLLPFLATMLPISATMSNEISKPKTKVERNVQFVSTLSKGRNFTTESFDIYAFCGNKVEHCFDDVACFLDIVAGVDGALHCWLDDS